ncbi:Crp/Fnr family transcriptional regulator [Crocinitomix sp.]|nr:Crp/Fnr family transcriptional regulator [Crocinitomix sp.]
MIEKYINNIKSRFENIFEPALITDLIKNGKIRTLEEGEILINMHEEIHSIPLMLSGAIKILREDEEGREMFLYYVESGSTCAASLTCSMNNHKSNIVAIVEEQAEFISIPVNVMDDWMGKYKSWRTFILSNYASRYDELLLIVDILAFKKMDERILNYLNEKAALHHTDTIKASHHEIAIDLNTSREVVSRILKQLERSGTISLQRGKIILNPITLN